MTWVLWIAIAVLLAVLVGLQLAGVGALRSWGVEPSRGVLALRVVNVVLVVGVVLFALWMWVR